MAEAASAAAPKAAPLQYTASKFPQYYKQLRALCLRQKNASLILSAFTRDPIQHYYEQNCTAIDNCEAFAAVGAKDAKGTFQFKNDAGVVIDNYLKADPAQAAKKFYNAVCLNKINAETTEALFSSLQTWVEAEFAIYAIVVATLKNAPHYIQEPEGAGRMQLQHLQPRRSPGFNLTIIHYHGENIQQFHVYH